MKLLKRSTTQLLLPHLQPDRPPADLPANKQRDLASALAELLLQAAVANGDCQKAERKRTNESETHA
jgi:hypothetical protein